MNLPNGKEPVFEGQLLLAVDPFRRDASNLSNFVNWLGTTTGLHFADYKSLWQFSIQELERFWTLWWCYLDSNFAQSDFGTSAIKDDQFDPHRVLASRVQPAGNWFKGECLNYVRYALARDDDSVAVIELTENSRSGVTYRELRAKVAALSHFLVSCGVTKGDRVVGYLPNGVFALVGFLATAAIGAIWSSCSPDFGSGAVIDRFAQIEPVILLACTNYQYGGRTFDRSSDLSAIVGALSELTHVVLDGTLDPVLVPVGLTNVETVSLASVLDRASIELPLEIVDVEFSHPLWILYSSGTTGLPKAIVQSQGGIFLEHTRALSLHCDLKPSDRFFWYTTTGWMMWNFLVSGLLLGATVVLVDGSVAFPDLYRLYEIVDAEQVTFFGTSATFLNACEKAAITPKSKFAFGKLRTVGSTGAPLAPEGFLWVYNNVCGDVSVVSASGGTDLCTAFLASTPWHETRAGELACATLGANVQSFDDEGNPLIDEVGELVICDPMPSMPVSFWNDANGDKLHSAYYSQYLGVWRHGDWVKIKPDGSAVIYGRSDSTLNRGGVRMGTSEFYSVVEGIPTVVDSLVIDTSRLGREGELVLLLVLERDGDLSQGLIAEIKTQIRESLSPRHVPDRIIRVSAIPRTINGKKMEVPIRRLFLGDGAEEVLSKGSMANPEVIDEYVELAQLIHTR